MRMRTGARAATALLQHLVDVGSRSVQSRSQSRKNRHAKCQRRCERQHLPVERRLQHHPPCHSPKQPTQRPPHPGCPHQPPHPTPHPPPPPLPATPPPPSPPSPTPR